MLGKMQDKIEFALEILWEREQIIRGIETKTRPSDFVNIRLKLERAQ